MTATLSAVVALVLIGFGGFLAASESALGILSSGDIREMAKTRRAKKSLTAIADDLRAHRNATNFVRIFAETTAAVLITITLAASGLPLWGALLISVLIMTVASFVLAGSSPRSVGRAHPQAILGSSAIIIHALRFVLGPIADALVRFGDKVTPGRPGIVTFTSEEQLLSMVDEATRHDVLENDERALIHSVFEWDDTIVREVMVPRIDMVTVDATDTLKTAATHFLDSGYSRVPVLGDSDEDVRGVVYLRDVARRSIENSSKWAKEQVSSVMRPVVFVPESKKVDDTLRLMQAESTHIAIVIDEHGGVAGLVTLEDIIEELVGEIVDEHDRGGAEAQQLDDGSYRVSARMNTEDLGKLFGLDLDDDDVDSVGGLLAKGLGRVVEVDDTAIVSGLRLTADRSGVRGKLVTRIRVERTPELIDAQDAFDGEEN
ncbi:MAG: hemolysin family protein [Actinobacteria bacterium]|nr:hemolysin family protein [Actinomycetota bacterium]